MIQRVSDDWRSQCRWPVSHNRARSATVCRLEISMAVACLAQQSTVCYSLQTEDLNAGRLSRTTERRSATSADWRSRCQSPVSHNRARSATECREQQYTSRSMQCEARIRLFRYIKPFESRSTPHAGLHFPLLISKHISCSVVNSPFSCQ